ncbi:hypothetical protein MKX01_000700 [Papaver californicum]|nr:hypothetical protein MKX01_000700 [Papaver californicum]
MDLRKSPRLLENPSSSTSVAAASITTTEKSHVEAEKSEKSKKKNDENAGVVYEKDRGRVWTEEGEIGLLKCMADFVVKGKNPNSDRIGFYNIIKSSIDVDFSFGQFCNKIRHARDKYLRQESEEKNGCVLRFSKPHLETCYELSKIIWGGGGEPKDGGGEPKDGGEGSVTVGLDGVEIRKSNREKKRKAGFINQGKDGENREIIDGVVIEKSKKKRKAGNAASVTEEQEENVEVDAVAEKLKEAAVEKQTEGNDGERKERNKNKKRKADNAAASASEKLKPIVEKQKQGKDGGEVSETAVVNKKKQKDDFMKEGKKDGEKKDRKDGAAIGKGKQNAGNAASVMEDQKEDNVEVDAVAVAEKQKQGKDGDKKERKKKKKRKAGHAASVLEKLKATADTQKEGFGLYELIQRKEQMIKPPPGLESFLTKKTKKAIQSIEPSKLMAFEKKWNKLQVAETEMFLKRTDLVHEYSSMALEALKSQTS